MRSFAALPAQIFGFLWWRWRVWGSWSACLALAQAGTCSVPFTSIPLQGISPREVLETVSPRVIFFFPWWCLGLIPWRKHLLPPVLPPPPPRPALVHNSWSPFITLWANPVLATRASSFLPPKEVIEQFFLILNAGFFRNLPLHPVTDVIRPWSQCGDTRPSWGCAPNPCGTQTPALPVAADLMQGCLAVPLEIFFSLWTHSNACTEEKSLLWADSRHDKNALDTAT